MGGGGGKCHFLTSHINRFFLTIFFLGGVPDVFSQPVSYKFLNGISQFGYVIFTKKKKNVWKNQEPSVGCVEYTGQGIAHF